MESGESQPPVNSLEASSSERKFDPSIIKKIDNFLDSLPQKPFYMKHPFINQKVSPEDIGDAETVSLVKQCIRQVMHLSKELAESGEYPRGYHGASNSIRTSLKDQDRRIRFEGLFAGGREDHPAIIQLKYMDEKRKDSPSDRFRAFFGVTLEAVNTDDPSYKIDRVRQNGTVSQMMNCDGQLMLYAFKDFFARIKDPNITSSALPDKGRHGREEGVESFVDFAAPVSFYA